MKRRYKRPYLYPLQEQAFFNDDRYGLIEASTKAGKTHGGLAWLLEQALLNGKDGRYFWWVAPVNKQARIAYLRMKKCLLHTGIMIHSTKTDQEITLSNGAVLQFKSGEVPDNLFGEDVYALLIDEASRVRDESWHACRSVLTATKGPIRMVGNVKGRKNWFYKMCRKAQGGAENYRYTKITAYDAVDAGVLDIEEINDAKEALPEAVFRELYLAEPSEDEGNPFGIKHIAAIYKPDIIGGIPEAYGADLAKSFDWTVLIGLDENGIEAYFDRWQGALGAAVDRIDNQVDGSICAVDSTSLGVRPVEELQEISDLYIPFHFSATSKQRLMEGLAVAIQRGEVTITNEILKNELDSFEYIYTRTGVQYSAPVGMHDDCVIALALAVFARGQNIETSGVL